MNYWQLLEIRYVIHFLPNKGAPFHVFRHNGINFSLQFRWFNATPLRVSSLNNVAISYANLHISTVRISVIGF